MHFLHQNWQKQSFRNHHQLQTNVKKLYPASWIRTYWMFLEFVMQIDSTCFICRPIICTVELFTWVIANVSQWWCDGLVEVLSINLIQCSKSAGYLWLMTAVMLSHSSNVLEQRFLFWLRATCITNSNARKQCSFCFDRCMSHKTF